ncbi:MAG: ATP-binding protein [Thermoplasmata archaeon]|nr:ATP-binding protein [Thermoplasmata archaeon]
MKIAIASGKGGTGKTTIALNLALSLENVQLMDCDVENPNCHLFLAKSLEEVEPVNLRVPVIDKAICTNCGKCGDFCRYNALVTFKQDTLFFPEMCHGCGGCTLVCPENAISEVLRPIGKIYRASVGNLDFWSGLLNIGEPMATPVIKRLKSHLDETKTTILDSPPGTACPVIETMNGADFVILVTEPTPFGLHDLKLAVEVVRILDIPFGVIVNRVGVGDNRVQEYCKAQSIKILLEIPQDRHIASLYSDGISFVLEMPEWKGRFISLFEAIKSEVGK